MSLDLLGRTIEAVVFDFDGVLVDTAAGWVRAEEALCSTYGIDYTAELAARTPGVGIDDAVAVLTEAVSADVQAVAAAALLRRLAEDHVPSDTRALQDAHESLEVLARTVPVAIASNSERPLLERLLDATGLGSLVGTVVSASDVTAPKPAPDVCLSAIALLGTAPRATLVVEDSPTGAAAAAAAGCPVAHVVPDGVAVDAAPRVPGHLTTMRGHRDLLRQLGVSDETDGPRRSVAVHRLESRR